MITKDTPVMEALRLHPKVREVFARYGMECVGCMSSANATIESAARAHRIDANALLAELNKPE